MTWKQKLLYFDAGMAANLALLLAVAHNELCFLFGFAAWMSWKLADLSLAVQEKKDENGDA